MTPIEELERHPWPELKRQFHAHRERQARLGGRYFDTPKQRPAARVETVEPVVVPIVEQEEEAEPVEVVVLPLPAPKLTIDAIKRAVCQHYGISNTDIMSDHRHRKVVRPRQVAIYLCRKHTTRSYPEIGRKFGGRDWTTCIHARRRVEEMISSNPEIAKDVAELEEFLLP